jgi:hypothetical protein
MSTGNDSISEEVLSLASELCGGGEGLAAALGVCAEDIVRWRRGESQPPSEIIFAALVLIEVGKQRT